MRGSLVFGLSYHTTKDLTGTLKFDGYNPNNNSFILSLRNDVPDTTSIPYFLFLTNGGADSVIQGQLNQSGNKLESGNINNWTFSGAIEISENVFIGANLNIIAGTFDSNNDYYEDDTHHFYDTTETAPGYPNTKDFKTFHLQRLLNWDISGWDLKLGFLYQISSFSRIGLTVQFPKTYAIKEKFDLHATSEFNNFSPAPYDYNDKVEYDIITPFELAGGFSINFKGLIFSTQLSIIDYSQLKFNNAQGLSESYIAEQNKNIKDLLGSVVNYNLGVEYTIAPLGIRLRGGYMAQPSPYKGDPSSYDHQYVTGGIGFLADETIGLDLGICTWLVEKLWR